MPLGAVCHTSNSAPSIGLPVLKSVTTPCIHVLSPFDMCFWQTESPIFNLGAFSRQKGPRIAEEVGASVESATSLYVISSTSDSRPKTSQTRTPSLRTSVDIWPDSFI